MQALGYRVILLGKKHIKPADSFPFEHYDDLLSDRISANCRDEGRIRSEASDRNGGVCRGAAAHCVEAVSEVLLALNEGLAHAEHEVLDGETDARDPGHQL